MTLIKRFLLSEQARSASVSWAYAARALTGGASGIDLATVELFARCGARVALNHPRGDPRGEEAVVRLREAGST